MYIYMHINVYIRTYIHIYIYKYIHTYTYIYISIHTFTFGVRRVAWCIRINFRTRQHVSIQVHVFAYNKDTILHSSWGDVGGGSSKLGGSWGGTETISSADCQVYTCAASARVKAASHFTKWSKLQRNHQRVVNVNTYILSHTHLHARASSRTGTRTHHTAQQNIQLLHIHQRSHDRSVNTTWFFLLQYLQAL